jgi:hypothetical protein
MEFVKPTIQTYFIVIGLFLLWGVHQIEFDPTILIRYVSVAFSLAPLTFLGIIASNNTRKKIKEHYSHERDSINQEIKNLRKEQDKAQNVNEKLKIHEDIKYLIEEMEKVSEDRFENCIKNSLILFIITLISTFINLGMFISTSNATIQIILCLGGLYYVSEMISSLFYSFKIE